MSTPLNWPTTQNENPEDAASIYILYHGLMCFAYNNTTGLCEVGMHAKASDHDFKIFAFQLDEGSTTLSPPIYSFEPNSHDDVPGGVVTIEIQQPNTPGVHFHFPATEDDYSWDKLLDLEGRDFYDRKLEKKKNILKPKVTINHGFFFVVPTTRSFLKIDEDTPSNASSLGPIAYFAVSTVRHDDGGTFLLKTEREELRLRGSLAQPLLIVIANSCPQGECSSNQSDFPQYYKAFKIKSNERKYRLEAGEHLRSGLELSGLSFLSNLFQQEPLRGILSNNDTPCGVGGYGRSSGIADSTS